MKNTRKSSQSIYSLILKDIRGRRKGSVFVPTDFLAYGSRKAVDICLYRLVKTGLITRFTRGVYHIPKQHPLLGLIQPSAEDVALALSGRDRTRIQPTGAYAANRLGLSEQVPAKISFLTDGPTRCVTVGKSVIELRRTTPRNMAAAGRLSGLLIQALRHLGQEHVTPARLKRLQQLIPADERRKLLPDLRLAPAWMHPIFRQLAAGRVHEPAVMLQATPA